MEKEKCFIEFFAGSGHISSVARTRGFETLTIDINKKLNPDWNIDILKYTALELCEKIKQSPIWRNSKYRVLWFSVPCTSFTKLMISNNWEVIRIGKNYNRYYPKSEKACLGLELLARTAEIIKILKPDHYFIENPVGVMRHLGLVSRIPIRRTVSYLNYGFEYLKPTDIFTNNWNFKPLELNWNKMPKGTKSVSSLNNNYERSLIPEKLINCIVDSCYM